MERPVGQSMSGDQLRLYRWLLGTAVLAAVALTTVVGIAATEWIGRPFPGFFVFPNRVIPSIGLTDWAVTRNGTLYQRTVVSVDGPPVACQMLEVELQADVVGELLVVRVERPRGFDPESVPAEG